MNFSKKHGFSSSPPIKFRHEAPEGLRYSIVQIAYDKLSYDQIRSCVCRILGVAPNRTNWSEVPNIRDEVESLMEQAEWYKIYDIAEYILSFIEGTYGYHEAEIFSQKMNAIFVETGAGWQFIANEGIVVRGDAQFEDGIKTAQIELSKSGFDVSEKELREALADLSRRPEADLTGAIHHALGALEATARYVDGSNDDLNTLANKIGLPKPLDDALKKMWGFSSNFGRHVSPTKIPTSSEAELIVHLSSAFCRYLANNNR